MSLVHSVNGRCHCAQFRVKHEVLTKCSRKVRRSAIRLILLWNAITCKIMSVDVWRPNIVLETAEQFQVPLITYDMLMRADVITVNCHTCERQADTRLQRPATNNRGLRVVLTKDLWWRINPWFIIATDSNSFSAMTSCTRPHISLTLLLYLKY